jgi:DNA-binding transcriptional regulator YdaS (Cro superfamily)
MDLKTFLSKERGRASALARAIGVSPVTVHQWAGGKQVPAERCPQIEAWSKGQVTCECLRPDLLDRWSVLRQPAA